MRKHEVQCKVEEREGKVLDDIQGEMNKTYVMLVANTLKRSNLSKEDQIHIIDQILGIRYVK